MIEALQVKCNNVERKCEWEGTVDTIEKHLATCQFTLLPCPRKCTDAKYDEANFIMRKDVDDHLAKDCPNRDYKCQHCGEKGTYTKITNIHDKICGKKIVPCPNGKCMKTMHCEVINKHVQSECEYTTIPCKYESIGCDVKRKRRELAAHEQNDKLHLHMALDTTLQLKSENEKLKSDVAELRRGLCSTNKILLSLKAGPQKYKLTDYQKKKETSGHFTFPPIYTHPQGYHVALKVYLNGSSDGKGTHVSARANIIKGNYDAQLKWPLLGSVTFTLFNQLENKNHYSMVLILNSKFNARVGSEWGFPKFIPHSALGHNPVKNTQYLKDDTLYFRMSVSVSQ